MILILKNPKTDRLILQFDDFAFAHRYLHPDLLALGVSYLSLNLIKSKLLIKLKKQKLRHVTSILKQK